MAIKNYKSAWTRLMHISKESIRMKEKYGWTRENGAGFIVDDIQDVAILRKKRLLIKFPWGSQCFKIGELNLRETEELYKYAKDRA